MKKTLSIAIMVALGTASFASVADIRFNGFASIVAGTTMDEEESLFGYNDNFSFKPESIFALQASADLSDGLSATTQIMARGENDFEASFEWAYLTYELTDDSQISAGRMRVPFYRYSDFLDVGYAYNWVRPPTSVYSLNFSTYEGISYINNHTFGMFDSSIQLLYGGYEGNINVVSDNDPASLNGLTGVNWTVTYDWLTARAAYFAAETSINLSASSDLQALSGTLNSVGLTDVVDELLIEDEAGSFFGLGLSADYNNFIFDAEYTEIDVPNSLVAKQSQYYASFGYRMDDITVIATIENRVDEFEASKFGQVPTTIMHPQFGEVPFADPSNGVLVRDIVDGFLMSQESERDTMSLSVRYSFHPAAMFKVDYTTQERKGGDEKSILSAAVNLVF